MSSRCGGATKACLTLQATSVSQWHVNGNEPRALDYNDCDQPGLYNPDAYRSSDHDPAVVGLSLGKWRKVWLPVVVEDQSEIERPAASRTEPIRLE